MGIEMDKQGQFLICQAADNDRTSARFNKCKPILLQILGKDVQLDPFFQIGFLI